MTKLNTNNANNNNGVKKIDIIKSLVNKEIIDKVNNGTKKEINARDCLASLTQLDKLNTIFTSENKKDLVNILTFCVDFQENEIDFDVKINANIKNQINDLVNKVVNIDNIITHKNYAKILKLALISCFGFKFETKDKTSNLKTWIVKRKNISIQSFIYSFIQAFCFVCKMQIILIDNENVFVVNSEDFNDIKKDAYTT